MNTQKQVRANNCSVENENEKPHWQTPITRGMSRIINCPEFVLQCCCLRLKSHDISHEYVYQLIEQTWFFKILSYM